MEIIYTKHSEDKLKTKEAKKFKITKAKIDKVIKDSDLIVENQMARIVGKLDKNHSLCVIIKVEAGIVKVITFFPAEKERYESQILS